MRNVYEKNKHIICLGINTSGWLQKQGSKSTGTT